MECKHACEQFAAKLDEAQAVSLSMGLQEQVEAMKLLFTFLEHLQKDIMQRLSEKSYDIVCHKITTSGITIKDEYPRIKPENDVSATAPPSVWSSLNTDLHLSYAPESQFPSDIAMATDKVSVMQGLRNKILSAGSTTLRRQTARKSGPRCKLDNLSKFLQQRATMNRAAAVSSGTTLVAIESPMSLGNQLAFNHTSPSVSNSREVSPLTSTPNAYMTDVSASSSLSRKRHQRRDKVNGRYFCNFPQCHESYLNLEHIVDHENQHSVPDGKYLECSFVGCNNRFKWRHYLRRHERTHHKPCEVPGLGSDAKPMLGSLCGVATSSGSQLDTYVGQPFHLPFIPTTATPISGDHLGGVDGAVQ